MTPCMPLYTSVVGLGGCNKCVLLSVESMLDAADTVGDLVGISTANEV